MTVINGHELIKPHKIVTVDGKVVRAHIIELDPDEGWVKVELPPILEPELGTVQADGYTDLQEVDMYIKILKGKVEIT